jgi:hypothetical protein
VSKNSKHWSNERGPSSTTKIVQRNNSERSNATSQCIWIQMANPRLSLKYIRPVLGLNPAMYPMYRGNSGNTFLCKGVKVKN